jgi:hypothetical protein
MCTASPCKTLSPRLPAAPSAQATDEAHSHRRPRSSEIASGRACGGSVSALARDVVRARSGAPLFPACRAACAAGHHGCALACGAPISERVLVARVANRFRPSRRLPTTSPITLLAYSCWITGRCAQIPCVPSTCGSARGVCCGRASVRTIVHIPHHHRSGNAHRFVGENHRHVSDGTSLEQLLNPSPGHAAPDPGPVRH